MLMADGSPTPKTIYHERQQRQLCALHALNNLFQSEAFTKQDLDDTCKELAPDSKLFNPHKSVLGLGCYDVNVIICALAKKGFDVIWFDKRKDLRLIDLDKIFGLILNVPNTPASGLFAVPLNYIPIRAQIWSSQKHWIAIRKIQSSFYNLDSKLIAPYHIGNEEALIQYLKIESSIEQVEILLVVPKGSSEDQSWQKEQGAR